MTRKFWCIGNVVGLDECGGVILKEEDPGGRRDGLGFVNIQIGKERRGCWRPASRCELLF